MKQLARLQLTFQNSVLNRNQATSANWISANGRATPETRLSVYTQGYRARLKEVLSNDFPAMLMAIGEDQFYMIADDYIDAHPSHYFNIREFGAHLSDFVCEWLHLHDATEDTNWLYELALFEWILGEAFTAADAPVFTEQDMVAIAAEDWPELKFNIHPSLHHLDIEWNIIDMWQALSKDNPVHVDALRGPTHSLIVWREKLHTRFRSLQTDEQCALEVICQGGSFADACEALAKQMRENEVPMHAATLLKSWLVQGLISGIRQDDAES